MLRWLRVCCLPSCQGACATMSTASVKVDWTCQLARQVVLWDCQGSVVSNLCLQHINELLASMGRSRCTASNRPLTFGRSLRSTPLPDWWRLSCFFDCVSGSQVRNCCYRYRSHSQTQRFRLRLGEGCQRRYRVLRRHTGRSRRSDFPTAMPRDPRAVLVRLLW